MEAGYCCSGRPVIYRKYTINEVYNDQNIAWVADNMGDNDILLVMSDEGVPHEQYFSSNQIKPSNYREEKNKLVNSVGGIYAKFHSNFILPDDHGEAQHVYKEGRATRIDLDSLFIFKDQPKEMWCKLIVINLRWLFGTAGFYSGKFFDAYEKELIKPLKDMLFNYPEYIELVKGAREFEDSLKY